MKKKIITLLISLVSFYTSAQNHDASFVQPPAMTPVSPNAASLGIFGDIPVGHYTGIPSISLPLYEFDFDGMKFPISLNYHASGIKVGQEASWVGLGWALNAGGSVIKNIQGYDDFEHNPTGYFYAPSLPANPGSASISSSDNRFLSFLDALNGNIDTSPDIYSFFFGNHTGSCYFPKASVNSGGSNSPEAVIRTPTEYLRITRSGNKIVAIDGNGYCFHFGSQEVTKTYARHSDEQYNNYLNYIDNKDLIPLQGIQPEVVTAYMLDSIVSPRGSVVSFDYETELVTTPVFLSEESYHLLNLIHSSGNPNVPSHVTNSRITYSQIRQQRLKKIRYKNLIIEFQGTDRADLEPADTHIPQKLSRIIVKNGSDTIRTIGFDYTYIGTPGDYNNCRMYLASVYDLPDGVTPNRRYTFEYLQPEQLPAKTSTLIDYWGFAKSPLTPWCNCWSDQSGAGRNTPSRTLIPSTIIRSATSAAYYYGQDRFPDSDSSVKGSLRAIQYPTGGKTYFTYEAHTFDNGFETGMENTITHTLTFDDVYMYTQASIDTHDCFANGPLFSDAFTLNSETAVAIRMFINYMLGTTSPDQIYHGYEISIWQQKGNTFEELYSNFLPDAQQGPQMGEWKDWNLRLQAGTYKLSLKRNFQFASLPSTEYQAQGQAILSLMTGKTQICQQGGGIRIKEIRDTSEDETTRIRRFQYTGGKLMSIPRFHYIWNVANQTVTDLETNTFTAQYLYGTSTSLIPCSNSAAGSPVGYDCVKEELWDGTLQGSVVYTFHNTVDEIPEEFLELIPGIPAITATDNGLPIRQAYLSASGDTLRTEVNTYFKTPITTVKGLKMFAPLMENRSFGLYYYNIPSEKWLKQQTVVTEYDGDIPHKHTEEYVYNAINLRPSVIRKNDSDGTSQVLTYTYADSSNTGIAARMRSSHLYNLPLQEEEKKEDGTLLHTTLTNYKESNGHILTGSIAEAFGQSAPRIRLEYAEHDSYGNPLHLIEDGNIHSVFLWSYYGEHIVARIENASYAEVADALLRTGTTPDKLSRQPEPNMTHIDALRTALPNAHVYTYEYRPQIGIIKETNPRGISTHYEYDSMGRLKYVRDRLGNILHAFDYQYKH